MQDTTSTGRHVAQRYQALQGARHATGIIHAIPANLNRSSFKTHKKKSDPVPSEWRQRFRCGSLRFSQPLTSTTSPCMFAVCVKGGVARTTLFIMHSLCPFLATAVLVVVWESLGQDVGKGESGDSAHSPAGGEAIPAVWRTGRT